MQWSDLVGKSAQALAILGMLIMYVIANHRVCVSRFVPLASHIVRSLLVLSLYIPPDANFQSNPQAHMRIHSGNKPVFQCELCPTTCGRKTDLRIHMQKLHSLESVPMECSKCGKTFDNRYDYKLHTRGHEGERTYKCSEYKVSLPSSCVHGTTTV